jgi:predicted RNA-binding Zn ribbon-like protein
LQVPINDYRWGAGVATELVNTAPPTVAEDRLASLDQLAAFLRQHDLHPPASPTHADLTALRQLREPLRTVIESPDVGQAVAMLNGLLAAARPVLDRGQAATGWAWYLTVPETGSLTEQVQVLTAGGLLAALCLLGHDRFRRCASPTCHGVFVDTTRAGRRRYCMPAICGNRVNVSAYRARRRRAARDTNRRE